MKFCELILESRLPQKNFHALTVTQTDKHFPKIVKSCSEHLRIRKT